MKAAMITELAARVADVAATDGGELLSVAMSEMADGSGRSVALVETYSAGLEQTYRISSPAPSSGPAWTRGMTDWLVEVRVDEAEWLALADVEETCECGMWPRSEYGDHCPSCPPAERLSEEWSR